MSTGLPRARRLASVETHRARRHTGEPRTPRLQQASPASLLLTEPPLGQGPGAQLRPPRPLHTAGAHGGCTSEKQPPPPPPPIAGPPSPGVSDSRAAVTLGDAGRPELPPSSQLNRDPGCQLPGQTFQTCLRAPGPLLGAGQGQALRGDGGDELQQAAPPPPGLPRTALPCAHLRPHTRQHGCF